MDYHFVINTDPVNISYRYQDLKRRKIYTTSDEAAQVVALIQSGRNQSQVGRQLNLSRSAVRRVYRFLETGSYHRRRGSGRHRVTSRRDDRFVVTTALRNRQLLHKLVP